MRIIKMKTKNSDILLSCIPSLWKLKWFGIRWNTFIYRFYLNIMIIGFQFRIIIYKRLKEVSISELKQMITERRNNKTEQNEHNKDNR